MSATTLSPTAALHPSTEVAQAEAVPARRPVPYLALLPILLLAFAFLVHWLDFTPLWADEGWTIQATDDLNPVVTVRDWVAVDVHPPLFFILLDGWRAFTGDSIFELRYFSVLLSLLGVAVMFRLGQSVYSTRAGVLAALFYGLHDLVKVLTQEVRHYPLQMLLVAVVLWMYWRWWRRGWRLPKRSTGLAFVLAGAALLYTHYWGGFVLLGLAVHALLTARKRLLPFIVAFAAIGLLYLPWLPVVIRQVTMERPFGLPHALTNGRYVYAVLIYQLVGVPELFWIVMGAAGLIGSFSPRRWPPTAASLLPLPVILLPPLLSVLINTVYPILSFRSLAVVVPAVMLLAAHGLSRFRMPEQGFIVAFVLLYSLSKTSAQPLERPPWPPIAAYLGQHTTAQDAILLELNTDVDPMTYYLDRWGGLAYAWTERLRLNEITADARTGDTQLEQFAAALDSALDESGAAQGVWIAQFGWEAEKDLRPWLYPRGYAMSAPVITYAPDSPTGFAAVPEGGMPFRYNDGRPIMLWRLDQRPQTPPLATYGDTLQLLNAQATTRDQGVTVNLLWSPLEAPGVDYSTSVLLLRDGVGAANHDSYPLDGLSPTAAWQADGLYFDSHFIDTTALAPGMYQVAVQVYRFTDASFSQIEHLPADDCTASPDCHFVIVGTVEVD
ncbi:MAG: glycosyltransferase family 39 protein [bacterium]|nr:glycosyltransferase family 39 protein [bacterium]